MRDNAIIPCSLNRLGDIPLALGAQSSQILAHDLAVSGEVIAQGHDVEWRQRVQVNLVAPKNSRLTLALKFPRTAPALC